MSSDLLKEAIADAKAVRETALQNAKMALEEAFTPQLKSMLVAKLKEDDIDEMGKYEDDEMGDEEPEGDMGDEEPEEMSHDEMSHDEMSYEDDEMGDDEEGEEDMEEEGLELEDIIRELEAELSEAEDEDDEDKEEMKESDLEESSEESEESVNEDEEVEIDEEVLDELKDDDDDDDKKDDVDEEVDQSSGIGKGTGRGNTDRSSAIGGKSGIDTGVKMEAVQAELKEYKEAVTYLKDKLHEVNILNAKLLFTNKLFKEFALDNNQKLKVVETFDRAQTTREIKLVYSTLAEQFTDNGSIGKRNSIKESASSAVGSTKPSTESKKVISEESQVADRFRKLAGILND